MEQIPYSDLLIVGFNGIVKGVCGYDSALVRYHPADNRTDKRPKPGSYFKLTFIKTSPQEESRPSYTDVDMRQAPKLYSVSEKTIFYDESEIRTLREDERLTRFNTGQEFPAFHEARVLYLTQSLLDAAQIKLPSYFQGNKIVWVELSGMKERTWATCLHKESVLELMNSWASALSKRCLDQLIDYFAAEDKDERLREKAERLSELGFGVARDKTLRSDILRLSGVAKMFSPSPRALYNLYFLFVKPEFKDLSWEAFQNQLNYIRDIIRVRAQEKHPISKEELYPRRGVLPGSQLPEQVMGHALTQAESPLALSELNFGDRVYRSVEEVRELNDERESISKAMEIADAFYRDFPPSSNASNSIIEMLKANVSYLKLDDSKLKVFASDPFFYLWQDAKYYLDRKYIDLYFYRVSVIEFNLRNTEKGQTSESVEEMISLSPLAKFALESFGNTKRETEEEEKEFAVGG